MWIPTGIFWVASPVQRRTVPILRDPGISPARFISAQFPERRLYLGPGERAGGFRYGVGVATPAVFSWTGANRVSMKREWPDWRPPASMRRRQPDLPVFMAGGIDNPLGSRALYIGSTLYRIHGSNEPHTIGQAVSSGCIRHDQNRDVEPISTSGYGSVRG